MKNLLSLTFPIGLILCGAAIATIINHQPTQTAEQKASNKTTIDPHATYYLFVSEIEIHPQALDEDNELEDWDSDSAPDLFYTLSSDDKEIFKSSARENSFIANWRGVTIPVALKDLQEIVKGDINIDIEFEKIIRAARVKGDSELELYIYDEDNAANPNDHVGSKYIKVKYLKEGDNLIENPKQAHHDSWKTITIKLVKREGSVKDFLLPLLRDLSQSSE